MSKKTLPTAMTYEELLAAMQAEENFSAEEEVSNTPVIEEILEYENNVVPFLSHYNIQPGEMTVSKKLLYELYKKHVDEPLEPLQFHRIVGKFIGHYSNYSGNFYRINQNQFAISAHIFKLFTESTVTKTKSDTYQRHFQNFLTTKNITKGKNWVQGYVIYEIYLDFCRDRHKKPSLSYRNFHEFLKQNFNFKRLNSNRALWFAVNDETKSYFNEEKVNEIEARRSKKKR